MVVWVLLGEEYMIPSEQIVTEKLVREHRDISIAAWKLVQAAESVLRCEVAPYKALSKAQGNRRGRMRVAIMEVQKCLSNR